MKPSRHIAASAVVSLLLAPWLKWQALVVFLGGIVLDVDRYVWYVLRYREVHPQSAISRFQGRDRIRGDLRVLHSIEFLFVLILIALFTYWVRILLIGVAFHLAIDLFIHKSRGRFWFYFDPSSIHCIALYFAERWNRRRAKWTPPQTGSTEDNS